MAAGLDEFGRAVALDHKTTVDVDLAEAAETGAGPGEIECIGVAGRAGRSEHFHIGDKA